MDEIPHDTTGDEHFDGFVVDALSAAALLGVNRTRLSQLTSKGVFPFQRRRIGTRLRLFYRRSDLEAHLEAQHRPLPPMLRLPQAQRAGAEALGVENPAMIAGSMGHTLRGLPESETKSPSPAIGRLEATRRPPSPPSTGSHPLPGPLPRAAELAEKRAQSELLARLLETLERMAERQLALEAELVSLRRSLPLLEKQMTRGNALPPSLPSARELARRRVR